MSYIYAFSSRNGALRFCDAINGYGGYAKIVNSPKTSNHGCGLAVRCDDYELGRDVLNRGYYGSLIAVYSYDGESYKCVYDAEN